VKKFTTKTPRHQKAFRVNFAPIAGLQIPGNEADPESFLVPWCLVVDFFGGSLRYRLTRIRNSNFVIRHSKPDPSQLPKTKQDCTLGTQGIFKRVIPVSLLIKLDFYSLQDGFLFHRINYIRPLLVVALALITEQLVFQLGDARLAKTCKYEFSHFFSL
jgi:hypothetical protein